MDEHEHKTIKLDGTFGAGTLTEVKVWVRVPNSEQLREETYTVPYLFLDLGRIANMHVLNLFAGFSLLNEGQTSRLKELGL